MAHKWASATLLKALFNLCFIVLFLQLLAFAEWVFAADLSWHSPIAHLIRYFAILLGAQAVSLLFFFRMPWISVVLGWLSVALVLARAIPWSTPAWKTVLPQFRFELVFLVLVHVGWKVFVMGKRAEKAEIAEVAGVAPAPSGSAGSQP